MPRAQVGRPVDCTRDRHTSLPVRYNQAIRWDTRTSPRDSRPPASNSADPNLRRFGLPFERVVGAELRAVDAVAHGPDGRGGRRASWGELRLATRRMTEHERADAARYAAVAWVPVVGHGLGLAAVWLRYAGYALLHLVVWVVCALLGAVVGLLVDPHVGPAWGLGIGAMGWLVVSWIAGRPAPSERHE